ncbi:hypothetical protein F8R89_15670 [Streptomyces sp. SS1-1]|nr:hypothetical protein F8R89_15670 [Streptomyces sp. SS1-1]
MLHTVRRLPWRVEQAGANGPDAGRAAASTAGYEAASKAAPAWLVLGTTRIPHKVPERTPDSAP